MQRPFGCAVVNIHTRQNRQPALETLAGILRDHETCAMDSRSTARIISLAVIGRGFDGVGIQPRSTNSSYFVSKSIENVRTAPESSAMNFSSRATRCSAMGN